MSDENCEHSCDDVMMERLRYFTGRHMTARDFRDEQWYHRSRRYLQNRLLHGWGTICGLTVHQHPVPECRKKQVAIKAGIALDCCGRDIIVSQELASTPVKVEDRPRDDDSAPAQEHEGEQEARRWYLLLCLHYREIDIECVPVLFNGDGCGGNTREHSRIREGYSLCWKWVRGRDLPKYGWKTRGGGCRPSDGPEPNHHAGPTQQWRPDEDLAFPCPPDDCGEPGSGTEPTGCLTPACPPDHCVPLAVIRFRPDYPIETQDIEMLGRPTVRVVPESLTHVCAINWPHGGVVPLWWLRQRRRLQVRFDRRLLEPRRHPYCGPVGINLCTFLVQYGEQYEDLDFVTSTRPPWVEHGCVANYEVDPRRRNRNDFEYLLNQTVHVTLKCDFILDCHGVPVDGDHLAGILPSGNGLKGGTFESWFRVVSDDEWRHMREDPNFEYQEEAAGEHEYRQAEERTR